MWTVDHFHENLKLNKAHLRFIIIGKLLLFEHSSKLLNISCIEQQLKACELFSISFLSAYLIFSLANGEESLNRKET